MNKRHCTILSIISDGHQATVNELSQKLSVSTATVRQDLSSLEKQGFLRRVHGGAVIDETDDISHRMAVNYDRKVSIARAAVKFVNEGETIFIESGSINALFAREISSLKNVTIITSNAFIARHIDSDLSSKIILIGGIFQKESECVVGNLAKECIENLNFSKAFIGIDGFTTETGFTGRDMMRAELNARVIQISKQAFILSDSSKFGRIALSKYCDAADISCLITDSDLGEEYVRYFEASPVNLIIADT
jgi:DeoR/GlpR family transcriptional regulator of sugar metabolism